MSFSFLQCQWICPNRSTLSLVRFKWQFICSFFRSVFNEFIWWIRDHDHIEDFKNTRWTIDTKAITQTMKRKKNNLLRWWWDENMTIKREIILLPLFFGIGLSLLMILFWWMVHIQASSHYFPFALILKPQKRVFIYSRIVNLFMNKEWLSGFSLRRYKQNLQSCRCWTKLKINSVFRRVHRAFN